MTIKERLSFLFLKKEGLTGKYIEQLGGSVMVRVFGIAITLLYIPLLLDFLNEEKYGIWITLTTIINWIRIFDVGLGNGLRNKLAEAIALDRRSEAKKLVSTSYAILCLIFLSILLVVLPLNSFLDWNNILKAYSVPSEELHLLTAVSISFILIGFVLQTVVVVFAADGNSVMGGVIQLVINIICLALLLVAKMFAHKGDLVLLATIITGVPLIVYALCSIYYFSGKYAYMRPSWKAVDLKNSGDLFKLSWQFFIIQITATVLYASIPFVITRFFSPKEVTQFNIASTIFNFPMTVIALITAPVGPLVTQAFAKGDRVWIRRMFSKMSKISLLISAGVVIMVLGSALIYKLWIGDRVQIPFALSAVVGAYAITNILANPYSVFLNSTGNVRILVILAPLSILLFAGCCYLYSWLLNDVISIPLAMITSNFIGLLAQPPVLKKTIENAA
jgi:O-antigen/teichoic acid export membrane protein